MSTSGPPASQAEEQEKECLSFPCLNPQLSAQQIYLVSTISRSSWRALGKGAIDPESRFQAHRLCPSSKEGTPEPIHSLIRLDFCARQLACSSKSGLPGNPGVAASHTRDYGGARTEGRGPSRHTPLSKGSKEATAPGGDRGVAGQKPQATPGVPGLGQPRSPRSPEDA